MPTLTERNPESKYYEYKVISGPWKRLKARFVGQPQGMPLFADFELRDGEVIRGPFRLPLSAVAWTGPRR
jgi:hypothetical protein